MIAGVLAQWLGQGGLGRLRDGGHALYPCRPACRSRSGRWGIGLKDRPRGGRPPRFTPVQRAEITAPACWLPAETGILLSRWSSTDLAREAVGRGIAAAMSASTVRRILAADVLKPWQHASWIFIRDPGFASKAARVLGLYQRTWNGARLLAEPNRTNSTSSSPPYYKRSREPSNDLRAGPLWPRLSLQE
ncbi:helix-turn-helix domain-containing protein [Nonomuraea sp. NPDC050404]|uniref:helix-turn-helix domain-containing protein n=1 Tax=Nonomuraea sp. NPDC050404 TaxID=3155783 RepID=UPI0033DF5478